MSAAPVEGAVPVTAEQLAELPGDGLRRELVDGEILTMPPTGWVHGVVSAAVVHRLRSWVREHDLGYAVGAETGFVLGRRPDTVRAPDAAFVRKDRMAGASPAGFAELAPDLVVEVLSPSDRASEVTRKALAWVHAGVRLVWVVDPEVRAVTVHGPGGIALLDDPAAVLDGGDVLPGFTLPLAVLFEDL